MPRAETIASPAALFAALGDPTRLALLASLADGHERSVSVIGAEARRAGVAISRQALAKHLGVMEKAGLVTRRRDGRESRVRVRLESIDDARAYLDRVASQWEDALGRLKTFIEE